MNVPLMVYFINSEMFARADVSAMAHHGFHGGIAMAMLFFSIREGSAKLDSSTGEILETKYKDAIQEIARGEAWGCMDITEPDAGSDMAQLRTVGEQDDDGNWFVTGEKIFFTSGHGKYHYVIARTEDSGDPEDPYAGLGGLSMFLVPTYHDREDGTRERVVEITRLEEKLGHHGSATCALLFDRAPAELIGTRGEGFKYMLLLMNNARVGVGFECIGLAEAAYRLAKDYAAERRSMGKSIDRHELIADYLDEMRTDIAGLRAITFKAAHNEELAQKLSLIIEYGDSLGSEERESLERRLRRAKRITRRLTPLLKYFGAEKAVEISRRCLQIHGGNGYTTEYGAEKLLRDALVMPIYEGTSQIQALMAMKDSMMGILRAPQHFVRRLAKARWKSISAGDELERRVAKLQVMSLTAQQSLLLKTAGNKLADLKGKPLRDWPATFMSEWNPKTDFAWALLHAESLIQLLTDEAIVEELWAQAQKEPSRAELLEGYLERAEPRARYLSDRMTNTGQRLLDRLEATETLEVQKAAE